MKRLNLETFKAKNRDKNFAQTTDKLLGQILGDCHDNQSAAEVVISANGIKKGKKALGY